MTNFTIGADGIPYAVKDPDSDLDYWIDWSAWLTARSDTIQSATWILDGVDEDTANISGTKTYIKVKGGVLGTCATLTCRLVTAGGRTVDRTFKLFIKQT